MLPQMKNQMDTDRDSVHFIWIIQFSSVAKIFSSAPLRVLKRSGR
jgi:hypothetical protein